MTGPALDSFRAAQTMDREAIRSVIADWALFRDTGRFESLRALFAPAATIQTTWFEGSADEFVDRSKASFGGAARALHFIGTSSVEVNGERATADTRIMLQLRAPVESALVDVTCYGRFFDFFVRHEANWRIQKRIPVYDKDRIDAVDPANPPAIDARRLAGFAEGYRHIAYVQTLGGASVTKGLIDPNSAAERQLYEDGARWLSQEPSDQP